ncbi:hypothetical protein D6C80_06569, partial [Aureobasidium pullulans]
ACPSSCCERKFGSNANESKKPITPPAIAAKKVQGHGTDLSSVEWVRPTVRRKLFSSVACTKFWKSSLNIERYLEYRISNTFRPNTLADQEIPGLDAMQTTNGRIFVSNKPNEDYEQDQQVSLHTRPMSR